MPVKALMFRGNAGSYTRLMLALNPSLEHDIIEIGTPDAMLRVRDCLARGEIVGILADRSTEARQSVAVPFLGDPAPFPTGPAAMAAALGTPVVLFFGIRPGGALYGAVRGLRGPDRRRSAHRAADSRRWVERYADQLAEQCRSIRSTGSTSILSGSLGRMPLRSFRLVLPLPILLHRGSPRRSLRP